MFLDKASRGRRWNWIIFLWKNKIIPRIGCWARSKGRFPWKSFNASRIVAFVVMRIELHQRLAWFLQTHHFITWNCVRLQRRRSFSHSRTSHLRFLPRFCSINFRSSRGTASSSPSNTFAFSLLRAHLNLQRNVSPLRVESHFHFKSVSASMASSSHFFSSFHKNSFTSRAHFPSCIKSPLMHADDEWKQCTAERSAQWQIPFVSNPTTEEGGFHSSEHYCCSRFSSSFALMRIAKWILIAKRVFCNVVTSLDAVRKLGSFSRMWLPGEGLRVFVVVVFGGWTRWF